MEFSLPEELGDIRAAVRQLCDAFPAEYWRGLEPSTYPTEFVDALTEHGWLAAMIPEEYGGAGLQLGAASLILEEIAASGGNPSACHAQMYIMGTLLRHGSAAQKERWLPEVAAGRLRLQAFGVTEPEVGSDTTKIKTQARRTDAGWVVNGQKVWTSRAFKSDLMVLLARTTPLDEVTKKTEGLSVFLVDMRDRGDQLTIRPIRTMMNHSTTEVVFDGLDLNEDALIGDAGQGFRYVLRAAPVPRRNSRASPESTTRAPAGHGPALTRRRSSGRSSSADRRRPRGRARARARRTPRSDRRGCRSG